MEILQKIMINFTLLFRAHFFHGRVLFVCCGLKMNFYERYAFPQNKAKQKAKEKKNRKKKKDISKETDTCLFSLFLEHYDKRNRDIVFGVALLFLGCGCKEER